MFVHFQLERMIRNVIREFFVRNPVILRRQDVADNVIEIDYVNELTPPFLRQESEKDDGNDTNESDKNDDSDSNGDDNDDDDDGGSDSEENDKGAEESVEENITENDKASKQDSGLVDDGDGDNDDNDSDYSDEPPGGGDGEGGGVLGLLAGLSGGVSTYYYIL